MAGKNGAKFDLSKPIQEVQELARALEALGGISQNLFSNLDRLTSTLSGGLDKARNSASSLSSNPAGPTDFMTSQGMTAATEHESIMDRDLRKLENIRQAVKSGGMFTQDDNITQVTSPTSSGNKIIQMKTDDYKKAKVMSDYLREKQKIQEGDIIAAGGGLGMGSDAQKEELEKAAKSEIRDQQSRKTNEERSDEFEKVSGTRGSMGSSLEYSMALSGTRLSDVPGITQSASKDKELFKDLSNTISRLTDEGKKSSGDNAEIMKQTASVLADIKNEFKQSKEAFERASENYKAASALPVGDARRIEAQRDLRAAADSYRASRSDLETAQGGADNILGGGGGGGRGRFGRMMGGFSRGLPTGAGAILGAGKMYLTGLQAEQTLDTTLMGKRLQAEQASGQAAQTAFETVRGAYNLANPESLLKNRADILMPWKKFDYIGTQGYEKSLQAAAEDEAQIRDIQARERTLGTGGSVLGAGASVAALLGGAALTATGGGALPGIAMATGGAIGLASSIGGAFKSYFGSETTALEGGLEGGMAKTMGENIYGKDYQRRAGYAKSYQENLSDQRIAQRAEQFRQAEMMKNQGAIMALSDAQEMESAEKYAVSIVGPDAMSKEAAMGMIAQTAIDSGYADYARRSQLAEKEARQRAETGGGLIHRDRYMNPLQLTHPKNKYKADMQRASMTNEEANIAYRRITNNRELQAEDLKRETERNLSSANMVMLSAETPNYIENLDKLGANAVAASRLRDMSPVEIASGIKLSGSDTEFYKSLGKPFADDNIRQLATSMEAAGVAPTESLSDFAESKYKATTFETLGISPSEYIMRDADLKSALNSNKGNAGAAINLSRAGVGSFSQLMGNLASISAVSGGQEENFTKLEKVLTQAVAYGFDKSRMAQRFVQSSIQMAESLGVKNTEDMAQRLGASASYLGLTPGGKPDELGLKIAEQGMMGLAAETGQSGGRVGTQKAIAALGAGSGISTGLAMLGQMNYTQMSSYADELEGGGAIRDPKLQNLVRLQRANGSAKTDAEARQMVARQLRATMKGSTAQMRMSYKLSNRVGIDEEIASMKGMSAQERIEKFQDIRARAANVESLMGNADGSLQSYALQEAMGMGIISRKQFEQEKSKLKGRSGAGTARFTDYGSKSLRRFIDQSYADSVMDFTGSAGEAKEAQDILYLSDAEKKDLVRKGIIGDNMGEKISRIDAAKAIGERQARAVGAQAVMVTNFNEVTAAIRESSRLSRIGARKNGGDQ